MAFYGPLVHAAISITKDWLFAWSVLPGAVLTIIGASASVFVFEIWPSRERRVSAMSSRVARIIAEAAIGIAAAIGVMFVISLVYYAPESVLLQASKEAKQAQKTNDAQQLRTALESQTQKCNAELAQYKRPFYFNVDNVLYAHWPRVPKHLNLFAQITMINQGPPSIATGYQLRVDTGNGPPIELTSIPIPKDPLAATPAGRGEAERMKISPTTDFAEKTAKMIATGDMRRGWLMFHNPGDIPDETLDKSRFVLTFTDSALQQHVATTTLKTIPGTDLLSSERLACPGISN